MPTNGPTTPFNKNSMSQSIQTNCFFRKNLWIVLCQACRILVACEDTSTASADYKPLAVVSADTSATEISEFESDGYEMSSAVDCVHWILAIEIPLVALSLLSQSHVLLLGNLLVGELIPGEVEVSQIAKSELTTVTFRIDTENLDATMQGIGNISFAEMKAWGIETVKPVDATI